MNLWHNHKLLNALADLLYLAAGALLLALAAVWVLRVSVAPVRRVQFEAPLVHVQAADIDNALAGILHGNFLALNLDMVRGELEKLPWIRRADVRRRWPAQLDVRLEEQVAMARWGDGRGELVNGLGEVFVGSLPEAEAKQLPLLYGPPRSAPDVIGMYRDSSKMLESLGLMPREVILTQRMAWQLRLADGMQIMLGRDQGQVAQRLQRFAELYPSVLLRRDGRPQAVDMRYPNGVALRLAAAENASVKQR